MDNRQTPVPQSLERLGYTVAEACKVIPCSRSHLHRAIREGRLRAARDGAKVLISRDAIVDYLNHGDGTGLGAPAQAVVAVQGGQDVPISTTTDKTA
ncbi:MAG: helix-turn-helix domain-containing protein [Acidimicrobiales bacterium]